MENWLLSDKEKNYDIEWLVQNNEQLFDVISNHFKSKDEKIISKLCSKLTSLYKEKDAKYQHLIINLIPILVNYYFIHFYEEKICSIIEVCLLTIYNLSLTDENIKLNRIRIPNISLSSVYHTPQVSSTQSELTESALSKLESEYVILEEQFKPYLDTINSEKRFNLIRFLLLLYLSRLPSLTKQSRFYFCDMCLKICKINRSTLKTQAIYLNSQILIEMLHGLYYLFNNNLELDAYIAIEAISMKAEEELLVDVMLLCNSIKNLIQKSKKEFVNQSDVINKRRMSEKSSPPVSKTTIVNVINNELGQQGQQQHASPSSGSEKTTITTADLRRASLKFGTAQNVAPLQQQMATIILNEQPAAPPGPAAKTAVELPIHRFDAGSSFDQESIPVIDEANTEFDEETSSYSLNERV